jgi:hypothetical protein
MQNSKCKIVGRSFVILHLTFLIAAAAAVADERVSIAGVQADPGHFNLRVVTVSGTVHGIRVLRASDPDMPAPNVAQGIFSFEVQCVYVHPAYTFVLADETGFLPIYVRPRPPCVSRDMPPEDPDVANDEAVLVDIQVTAVERDVNGVRKVVPEALALAIRKDSR